MSLASTDGTETLFLFCFVLFLHRTTNLTSANGHFFKALLLKKKLK